MDMFHNVMARLKVAQIARDEEGVAALEYALIAALIGLAIIVGVTAFGTSLNGFFNTLSGKVTALVPAK